MELSGERALATEIEGWEGRYLADALEGTLPVETVPGVLSEVEPGSAGGRDGAHAFYPLGGGERELAAMPRLKLVATRFTGHDHVDLTVAKERGVAVANVPGYGENTVAEHTFVLILALSRKRYVRRG